MAEKRFLSERVEDVQKCPCQKLVLLRKVGAKFQVLAEVYCKIPKISPFMHIRDWSKSIGGGVGRSREGVGHEVLSLVQGMGRAICGYP